MRIDRFVFQHLQRIDDKLKERCKVSDALPNDADEESEKQNITDVHEFPKAGRNSEATKLQDTVEVDDLQHATTKNVINVEISRLT